MARSRGSGSSSRGSAFSRQPSRSASTMAAPRPVQATPQQNAYSHPPAASQSQAQSQGGRQPGMFAQMASTAAGVAVGSAVGHTIGAGLTGMFSGSGSEAQPAQLQTADAASSTGASTCDVDARNFTRCLESNDGNMQICDYYLQQLKACQEAARQY